MRLIGLLCVAVALVGCEPSEQEKKDAARTKQTKEALATLDANRDAYASFLEPVIKSVNANPAPLTTDGVIGVTAPLVDWLHGGSTILLMEWDAKSAHQKKQVRPATRDGKSIFEFWMYRSSDDPSDVIYYWSGVKTWSGLRTKENAQAVVDHVKKLQYVVVIRVLEFVAPKLGETTSGTDVDVTPGHVDAEARIFDVKGADHGGFLFQATHSGDASGANMSSLHSALLHDLEINGEAAFQKKLTALIPSSRIVFKLLM